MRPIAAKESVLGNYRSYISPVFLHRPSHYNGHNFGEETAERKEISLNRQKEAGDSYLVVTLARGGGPSIGDLVKSVGLSLGSSSKRRFAHTRSNVHQPAFHGSLVEVNCVFSWSIGFLITP